MNNGPIPPDYGLGDTYSAYEKPVTRYISAEYANVLLENPQDVSLIVQ
jgi:hypothetical protein